MSNRQIDFQDVLQLVELVKSSSNFSELRLRSGDIEIELRRGCTSPTAAPITFPAPAPAAEPAQPAKPQADHASSAALAQAGPAPVSSAPSKKPHPASQDGMIVIKSPMVGTVYHAAEPGATPFVKVGQCVAPGDQICIIEVMKLMNSINADCHGVVTEVLVADGAAVEYGEELFVISTR